MAKSGLGLAALRCRAAQVEVRKRDTGEVTFRDHLSCPVSAVLSADYRNDGHQQVVVCGLEGEVSAPPDTTRECVWEGARGGRKGTSRWWCAASRER